MNREPSPYLDTVSAACAAMKAGLSPEAVGRGEVLAQSPGTDSRRSARSAGRGASRRKSTASSSGIGGASDLDEQGRVLLEALRAWRLTRARAASTPAFVICNDRTLIEIADRRPATAHELLAVHGFGEVKVARFGPELLAIINGENTD
jgi:ATP-dependent DNA helicase RecQ